MRLIDADALYKKVTEEYCDIVAGCYPFNIVAYDMAKMVKNAPPVEPVRGEWIPCSEKLPEKPDFGEDSYIVQQECVKTPFSAFWDGERWSDLHDGDIKGIIAWMPLPEPYKEEPPC